MSRSGSKYPKPLTREAHAPEQTGWRARPIGLTACALGGIAVAVSAAFLLIEGSVAEPDLRVIAPISALAVVAAGLAFARREPGFALPAIAICLAGAALVLGWIVVVGLIATGTAIVIGILALLL